MSTNVGYITAETKYTRISIVRNNNCVSPKFITNERVSFKTNKKILHLRIKNNKKKSPFLLSEIHSYFFIFKLIDSFYAVLHSKLMRLVEHNMLNCSRGTE